jgi:hypothetical protein
LSHSLSSSRTVYIFLSFYSFYVPDFPSSLLGQVMERTIEAGLVQPLCTACGALVGFEEIFGYRQWEDEEPFLDTENPTT